MRKKASARPPTPSSPDSQPSRQASTQTPAHATTPPRSVSAKDIDPNSLAATKIPNIEFERPEDHDDTLIVMRCRNPVNTCIAIREWLFDEHNSTMDDDAEVLRMKKKETDEISNPGDGYLNILRIEEQELHDINNSEEGTLLYLGNAAYTVDRELRQRTYYCIFALLMPRASRVRWFYSCSSAKPILNHLAESGFLALRGAMDHKTPENQPPKGCGHCRIYVWMREEFLKALHIPHANDYLRAEIMTDYAPDIIDPDTAYKRLEANAYLLEHPPRNGGKDMMDDRYKQGGYVDPVEVEVASIVDMRVSEYLIIKRLFFRDFYKEVLTTNKTIIDEEEEAAVPRRQGRPRVKFNVVRSDHAHQQWLERLDLKELKLEHIGKFNMRRARRLVEAWKELGLLKESRLLPWIRAGGMLAHNFETAEQEEDGDEKYENTEKEENAEQDEKDADYDDELDADGETDTEMGPSGRTTRAASTTSSYAPGS